MRPRVLRPRAVLADGEYLEGREVVVQGDRIVDVRPLTGPADPYVLSPAFVNAHSHLEYYGLRGRLPEGDWPAWIQALVQQKAEQDPEVVREDCRAAAQANRASGVALVGEHASRPGPAQAMAECGLGGVLFQETITFFERADPGTKLVEVAAAAEASRAHFGPVWMSPHATYTVDEATLRWFGAQPARVSVHAAETEAENELLTTATGPLADFERRMGFEPPMPGLRVVPYLREVGLLRPGVQLVHACAVTIEEVALIAASGASVAHCPRSNRALGCPASPVAEMLRLGVTVGIGMDSAASSGEVDMFAEMRAARGGGLPGRDVWRMATAWGARSIGHPGWDIAVGNQVPLIALDDARITDVDTAIEFGTPGAVSWI